MAPRTVSARSRPRIAWKGASPLRTANSCRTKPRCRYREVIARLRVPVWSVVARDTLLSISGAARGRRCPTSPLRLSHVPATQLLETFRGGGGSACRRPRVGVRDGRDAGVRAVARRAHTGLVLSEPARTSSTGSGMHWAARAPSRSISGPLSRERLQRRICCLALALALPESKRYDHIEASLAVLLPAALPEPYRL